MVVLLGMGDVFLFEVAECLVNKAENKSEFIIRYNHGAYIRW